MKARDFLKKDLLAVIYGGDSAEREVSALTAAAVSAALKEAGIRAVMLEANRTLPGKLAKAGVKFAFNAVHGRFGEDGALAGMLEMLGVRYTGTGIAGSALAFDKHSTKELLRSAGVDTPDWSLAGERGGPVKSAAALAAAVGLPAVLKPRSSGSALGVSILKTETSLRRALRSLKGEPSEWMVEEYVNGTEITIGFLGETILPAVEIVPQNSFYDFESKYKPGGSTHIIPARIPAGKLKEAQAMLIRCRELLGLSVMSRADFKISTDGKVRFLEVNTVPGMTGTSLFPDACRAAGIGFTEMILRILDISFE